MEIAGLDLDRGAHWIPAVGHDAPAFVTEYRLKASTVDRPDWPTNLGDITDGPPARVSLTGRHETDETVEHHDGTSATLTTPPPHAVMDHVRNEPAGPVSAAKPEVLEGPVIPPKTVNIGGLTGMDFANLDQQTPGTIAMFHSVMNELARIHRGNT